MIALLAYIGFGVLTLRATSQPLRLVGLVGALGAVLFDGSFGLNVPLFATAAAGERRTRRRELLVLVLRV